MKRSIDQALFDLREHVFQWAGSGGKPGIRIFVYPPEFEALMLARFPGFADECAKAGRPIESINVGQGFRAEIEADSYLLDGLRELEKDNREQLLHDLGIVAERYLTRLLRSPLGSPAVVRLLVNTGALGTFVSYSALTNRFHGDDSKNGVAGPTVLAFPGEGDDRSLNLLGLRVDTNYRVPRI